MKKYTLLLSALMLNIFYFAVRVSTALAAGPQLTGGFGLEETATEAGIKTRSTLGPAGFIGILIGYVLAFVGVIFFVLMVYGGFIWMTARGSKEKVDQAIKLIEESAIGIIIIFLSYIITNFVMTRITGAL